MAINKVIYGTSTLIDLTTDTVAVDTLGKDTTAHDKSGVEIIGTLESGGTGGGGAPNYMQLSFVNLNNITIKHNLNRIPIGIIIARKGWGTTSDVGFYCCALADGKRINGGHSGDDNGIHIYNSFAEINTLYGSN